MSGAFDMTLAEVAQAIAAERIGGKPQTLATGVVTDSRAEVAGALFVALKGEHFDGHEYLAAVKAAGAVAAIVDRRRVAELSVIGLPLIAVADPRRTLGDLAAVWRKRFAIPLVGVTGSNGKTTTKEMIAAIFAARARRTGLADAAVVATRGNLNNEIGVPMMLLELTPQTRYAVIEMGMNHPGEIARLAALAAPTVAVVTNAQRAHLEGMGSLAAIVAEKASIFEALSADGVAIINADDPNAERFARVAGARRQLLASLDGSGDVVGRYRPTAAGSTVEISDVSGTVEIALPLFGRHNARNAVLATAAALAAGATLSDAAAGLATLRNVGGRLRLRAAKGGARLLDDSYNANPDSMRAAIDVLADSPGTRILVIGDMGEIGPERLALHAEMGAYARASGIERLFALGESARAAVEAFGAAGTHWKTPEDLSAALLPLLDADTTVLVKGSRFMRMERVADALADESSATTQTKEDARCS
ncbi:MAG TPA: UDP-N-acetylmuramoyl-tripeptide--D-alanyl-D-alanine ligase [Rhodocyclaceae bacterium]